MIERRGAAERRRPPGRPRGALVLLVQILYINLLNYCILSMCIGISFNKLRYNYSY